MPTKKIRDWPFCTDDDHYPKKEAITEPGTYEHICPACGHREEFTVFPFLKAPDQRIPWPPLTPYPINPPWIPLPGTPVPTFPRQTEIWCVNRS